ncbi:MAG: gamma-glutamylcyclotransferase [Bauldia sp.]
MAAKARRMRLTPELVARVSRNVADPGAGVFAGASLAADTDHDATIAGLLADAPDENVWLFAYGSLIWKPACEVVEQRTGLARSWHRSFCLGWDRRFRGNPEQPGLMMALDRGGACKGVVQRLPPGASTRTFAKSSSERCPSSRTPSRRGG